MWKHTSMTASKLEEFKKAFSMWFTKAEAILYCNVPERTFFDYCSKNPEFTEFIPTLQNLPKLKAKMVILWKIEEKDDFNSRWYLEKTDEAFNPTKKNDTNLSWSLTIWWILTEIWEQSGWLLEKQDGLK